MQKRLVLMLLVAVGCACPIFAARAKYEIAAGMYLPAGATSAEQCPANSYCPGIADATYNESAAQGVTSCPSGYPNSAAGASRDTQCYTACTVDSANIARATAVDGNDYYDTGVDTCGATACENGYHVEDMIKVVEQTPLIDVDYTVAGSDYGYISANGSRTSKANTYGLTEKGTWATEFNYGVVYGRASCQATPHDPGPEYVNANKSAILNKAISPDTVRSDLTPIVGAPKANYMADVVAGLADGSKGPEAYYEARYVVFGPSKDALFSTTDTGQYCYCQMTGYQSGSLSEGSGTSGVVDIASAPWVFNSVHGSGVLCVVNCAYSCAHGLHGDAASNRVFRGAMYGALDAVESGICEANEITINWTDATAEDIAENNAGMCTYDGEIRTPKSAITIPGKRFVGWKFNKPAQE